MINKNICFLMAAILFLFFVGTSLNLELVNAQNTKIGSTVIIPTRQYMMQLGYLCQII